MSFLAGLFFGWMFWSPPPQPKCPPMHPIVVVTKYTKDENEMIAFALKNGDQIKNTNLIMATSSFILGEGWQGWEVGTTTDPDALAYNASVRECQNLNGEF